MPENDTTIKGRAVPLPVFTKEQEDRFWDLVDFSPGHGPHGDCYLWAGHILKTGGYGQFYHSQKFPALRAHRVAFFLGIGADPAPLDVLHNCDIRLCCNYDHYGVGTRQQNNLDRDARGRTAKGVDVHGSTLTPETFQFAVDAIKNGMGYAEVAAKLGMTGGGLHTSLHNDWKHLIALGVERPPRQRKRKTHLTPELAQQIKDCREIGLTTRQIVEKLGVSEWFLRGK